MHYSFDFDYTLADSTAGILICAKHALNSIDKPIPSDEAIKATIGLSLVETYRVLVAPFSAEEAEVYTREFIAKADEVIVESIEFYQHAPAVLKALKAAGHYVSIVSNKFGYRITAALERDGLSDYIDLVIGGDTVEPKPSPEGILKAIQQSGIVKEQTLYVGDSKTDGRASQSAGVRFCAVLTGETSKQELETFNPIWVLKDVGELPINALLPELPA